MSPGPDGAEPAAQPDTQPDTRPAGQPGGQPAGAAGRLRQRDTWAQARVLTAISVGGMVGATGRYAAELAWPAGAGSLPWSTLGVNVAGCALIGVLMVHVVETGRAHPMARPFLGVGLLGGFTTFSTYAVQTDTLLTDGHPALAMVYLVGTLVAALVAVVAGLVLARLLVRLRHRASQSRGVHHRKGTR